MRTPRLAGRPRYHRNVFAVRRELRTLVVRSAAFESGNGCERVRHGLRIDVHDVGIAVTSVDL
jgi:hypothetical protein